LSALLPSDTALGIRAAGLVCSSPSAAALRADTNGRSWAWLEWEAIGSKLFAKAGQGDVNAPLSLKAWAGLPGAQQKARRVRAGFWNQSGLQA
jgi:hypothetical protein